MASSGCSNPQSPAPQQQASLVQQPDLDKGTEMFRQMVRANLDGNALRSKPATTQAQPQTVSGGLPPHLLRQRENTNLAPQASDNYASANAIEPAKSQPQGVMGGLPPHLLRQRENADNASKASGNQVSINYTKPETSQPQAVMGGLPPHLLRQREIVNNASGSPAPATSREPPASEKRLRTQQRMTPQTRPSALQSRPQPAPSRDAPLNITPEHTYPPTPASRGFTRQIPLAQASANMHPVLKRAIGDRFVVTVRDTPPGSPLTPVWDDDPVDQVEDCTPKSHGIPVPQIKKWRPKHSEDLESQSLPSTAASVKFSDDSHFPDRSDDGKDAVTKDARANIADELDIVPKDNGDGWVNKHVWKDWASSPRSNGGADDSIFGPFVMGWRSTYCEDWIASISKLSPPVAKGIGKVDEHWKCDVDTKNGFFMSPVEYPETQINRDDPCIGAELDRRLRGTAAMQSTVEFLKMQKRNRKQDKQEREYLARNPPTPHWKRSDVQKPQTSPAPAPVNQTVARPAVETVQQSGQGNAPATHISAAPVQQAVQDDADSRMVKIPCHLRPAEPADAPQILEIYNWEVLNGTQALDTKPLVVQDIQRLLAQCKSAQMPFIVAVQGTPIEAACRKEAPAPFRGPYKQPRPTAPYQKAPEAQPGSDKILGFGFITCPVAGLAGSVYSNVGRFIGRVHFYVEHASRRNGIGRALLHRLTRCCSKFYFSVDWYEWCDPVRSSVFDEPDYNARNYSRLYIETSSTGEKDPDNGWYEDFLDGMGYLFMSTLDKTRKVKYGPDGQWRDTIVWQHDCRDHKGIPEFD